MQYAYHAIGAPPEPGTRRTGGAPMAWYAYCIDRKSTRLNSSHTVISYAVFCLKKKARCQRGHTETRPRRGGVRVRPQAASRCYPAGRIPAEGRGSARLVASVAR